MKKLSLQAQFFVLTTILAGTIFYVWRLPSLEPREVAVLLVSCALAAVTQVIKVTGTTDRSSYNIAWMVYGFTFVQLGTAAALFVILVAHLAEWIWHRYPWYIQLFNIASYALALEAASLVYGGLSAVETVAWLGGTLSAVSAMVVFTLVNHLFIALVIWLARGESVAESGLFSRLTLMIDFSLLCLGIAASMLWTLAPAAVVLPVIPLYLIYSTLRVPALERQTDRDAKTGLFNARYFNQALEKEIAHVRRTGQPLTVAMCDLDLLRNINNTYGHLAGDIVLVNIAQRLQKSLRAYDVVARFGGEEFALLMPEFSAEQALVRLEAIRAEIENTAFEIPTSVTPIQATMSMGIATLDRPSQTASELLHNADVALYHSKLTGRNRVSAYSNEGVQDLFSIVTARASTGAAEPTPQSTRPPAEPPAPSQPAAKGASEPTAPAATRRPSTWTVNVYILILALAALAGLWMARDWAVPGDELGLAFFAVMVMMAEGFSIDIYFKDASTSTAVVPYLAGVLLFGPLGALVLSAVLSGTSLVKHNSPFSRFIFNTSNHLLAGLLCLALAHWAGVASTVHDWPMWCLVTLGGSLLIYLTSTGLIATAIYLNTGQPLLDVWTERFLWLAPTYLVMGAVAFLVLFSYLESGLAGAVAIILPLVVLRFSQSQYLDRTKSIVNQLRRTNAVLEQQTQEVSTLNEELLHTLAQIVDMRDPYVNGHSKHVAKYAVLIATELGLPPDEIEHVRKAGLLHDIGKLGISEDILFKPGALLPAEYDIVKQHAGLGADLVAGCHSLRGLVPLIRHHHERFDGGGYPAGLKGEQIPLGARILSLADTIEAMASDRPYRAGSDTSVILKELQRCAGTQFDPKMVQAFSQVLSHHTDGEIVNSAKEVQRRSSLLNKSPLYQDIRAGLGDAG